MKRTKSLEERTLAMHAVEPFGLGLRQLHHARGDDLQAHLFKAAIHLANQITADAVRFDNG